MSYSLGVDLGTTFVAAAIAQSERVKMFTLGDRTVVTPAVVYAREDGLIVSGEAANRWAVSSPDRVGREFKRRLGDPTPVMLGGAPYIGHLSASRRCCPRPSTALPATGGRRPTGSPHLPGQLGPVPGRGVRGRPRLAEVADAGMITEPQAAGVQYAAAPAIDNGDTVAVYDLGGGTFDAAVLRKHAAGIETWAPPRASSGSAASTSTTPSCPHQLQLRGSDVGAGHEQPADRRRAGPAAPGLHPGQGGALDRHRGDDPGVPAQPALRRAPDPRRSSRT